MDPLRDLLQAALAPNIDIVRPLGRGGMGAVYLGRETALDREVAIKTLAPEVAGAPDLRERFRREARIAAKLTHPNIVPLYTFGETRDIIYFVMGFVRGETLAERLARGAVAAEESRRILAELADALAYAHERGIVHRDIKPENVLIEDATGRAILTDFGIARIAGGTSLTVSGGFVGTPQYMSPEQGRGEDVGPASDVFSLGLVGCRMLTGVLPARADSKADPTVDLGPDALAGSRPRLGEVLGETLTACLRNDSDARLTAAQLRDALRTEGDAREIPDEVKVFEGRLFYVFPFVLTAILLGAFEIFLWDFVEPGWRMAILGAQFAAAVAVGLTGVAFSEGKRAGIPPRRMLTIIMRQPRWYIGWVPRIARPPGDLWDRLPGSLKIFRITTTICWLTFVPLVVLLPFAILAIQANFEFQFVFKTVALAIAATTLVMFGAIIRANIRMARCGLSSAERSRALSAPLAPNGIWRETRFAAILIPEKASPAAISSPSQIGERIVLRARKLPPAIASNVVEAERGIAGRIVEFDAEMKKIEALLDPDDVVRVAKRIEALAGSEAESSEVGRLLMEQQRVFRELAARRDALTRRRESWLIRLRALDEALGGSRGTAEIEREMRAVRELLAQDAVPTVQEPTVIRT